MTDEMKLKVCGMKYLDNIQSVAELQPDYLGFIFYKKSLRNFDGIIPELPVSIKKVGVFVNATIDEVVSKIYQHNLYAVQLHGDETAAYIEELKGAICHSVLDAEFQEQNWKQVQQENLKQVQQENLKQVQQENLKQVQIEVIKVFGIKEGFDFDVLKPYESVVDYFLFDTKGKNRGGNGVTFDWEILKKYQLETPYFLSGGIGLVQIDEVLSFKQRQVSKHCVTIDVNSQFEIEPGVKSVEKIKEFIRNVITSKAK